MIIPVGTPSALQVKHHPVGTAVKDSVISPKRNQQVEGSPSATHP